jgi:parvulin-like peptidyl-prolyl isomerase
MKCSLSICAMTLLALSSVNGQLVSSHAPTAVRSAASPLAPLPAAGGLQVTGKPVVRVNGTALTDRDLVREMFALFPYAKLHNGFPKEQEPEIRRGAMEMIVFEELVYQDAMRRGVAIAPERLDREERRFAKQFSNAAEYKQFLAVEMDGSKTKLKQQIKRSLMIEATLKAEVDTKSVVSLSEARAYYTTHPKEFEHGEDLSIQTISIIPPPTANADTVKEARKHAEEVFKLAKATKSYKEFGLLAEQYSDDDFHVSLGDHKVAESDKLPPQVVKAARTMQPGQVSDLIQLGNAFTIFRLNSHVMPGKVKFEEIRKELTANLQKEKYERLRVALGKRLRQNAKIEKL